MSESLQRLWAVVREDLAQARATLSNPTDEELRIYEEFLTHNELGLALDALVDVASRQRAPGEVWTTLSKAAQTMGIEPDDDTHGATVRKIMDRLAAAHDWLGLQRLLNEWDPIGVCPELGGPDDEYDCLYVPLMEHLQRSAPASEIAEYLRHELENHFGLSSASARPEMFAHRLVEWFESGAPA